MYWDVHRGIRTSCFMLLAAASRGETYLGTGDPDDTRVDILAVRTVQEPGKYQVHNMKPQLHLQGNHQ